MNNKGDDMLLENNRGFPPGGTCKDSNEIKQKQVKEPRNCKQSQGNAGETGKFCLAAGQNQVSEDMLFMFLGCADEMSTIVLGTFYDCSMMSYEMSTYFLFTGYKVNR